MLEQFLAGYRAVIADVASGLDPEAAFDLACTPGARRPRAYTDGARAASLRASGDVGGYGARLAAAYGAVV